MTESPPTSHVPQQGRTRPALVVFACLLLALVGGAAALLPGITAGLALIACAVVAAIFFPVASTSSYLGFVLVQDLLVNFVSASGLETTVVQRVDEGFLAVLLVGTAARGRLRLPPRLYLGFACLLAALVIGLLGTLRADASLALATLDAYLLLKGVVFFLVVYSLPVDLDQVDRFIDVVLWIAVAIFVTSITDVVFGESYRALIRSPKEIEYRQGLGTAIAIFEHAGLAGWFFAFSASLALARWVVKRRAYDVVRFLLFVVGVLVTLRRKPLVGLLCVVLYAIVSTGALRSKARVAVIVILVVLAVGGVAGDVVVGTFLDMFDLYLFTPDPSVVARNALHLASFDIAVDQFPLGVGLGRFGGWVSSLYYSPVYYEYGLNSVYGLSEDNPAFIQDAFWPHVLGQLGFVGTALFLVFGWTMARRLLGHSHFLKPEGSSIVLAAAFALIEAIPESAGWVIFEDTLSSSFLFGLLALGWRSLEEGSEAPPATTE
jgi:hypothetical protein